MVALTHQTSIWANSGRWWRTGKSGVMPSMGLPRVRHHLATEQQQNHLLAKDSGEESFIFVGGGSKYQEIKVDGDTEKEGTRHPLCSWIPWGAPRILKRSFISITSSAPSGEESRQPRRSRFAHGAHFKAWTTGLSFSGENFYFIMKTADCNHTNLWLFLTHAEKEAMRSNAAPILNYCNPFTLPARHHPPLSARACTHTQNL